ncbi:MAG TPA: hypothetical protein VK603_26350 [Candidatus Saccharimonadales bacterium]|nr:hypothetical protein [Candidatus Saccharimonadales bacterium]
MARRTIHIQNAVSSEIARHEQAIDCDASISKIHLTVVLSRQSGMPFKVSYSAVSESRLTEAVKLSRVR